MRRDKVTAARVIVGAINRKLLIAYVEQLLASTDIIEHRKAADGWKLF